MSPNPLCFRRYDINGECLEEAPPAYGRTSSREPLEMTAQSKQLFSSKTFFFPSHGDNIKIETHRSVYDLNPIRCKSAPYGQDRYWSIQYEISVYLCTPKIAPTHALSKTSPRSSQTHRCPQGRIKHQTYISSGN